MSSFAHMILIISAQVLHAFTSYSVPIQNFPSEVFLQRGIDLFPVCDVRRKPRVENVNELVLALLQPSLLKSLEKWRILWPENNKRNTYSLKLHEVEVKMIAFCKVTWVHENSNWPPVFGEIGFLDDKCIHRVVLKGHPSLKKVELLTHTQAVQNSPRKHCRQIEWEYTIGKNVSTPADASRPFLINQDYPNLPGFLPPCEWLM